jgi:hypothetical protein
MVRVLIILAFIGVLLSALALISCLSVEQRGDIRGMPRWAWVIVIIFVPLAGAACWFLLGRPAQVGRTGTAWRGAAGSPQPRRPVAPDDDPDFLRSINIDEATRRRDAELLRRWEEDMKRREEETRRRDADGEG